MVGANPHSNSSVVEEESVGDAFQDSKQWLFISPQAGEGIRISATPDCQHCVFIQFSIQLNSVFFI